ncbi:hypothetical protein D9M71_420230 [compost metagenome]
MEIHHGGAAEGGGQGRQLRKPGQHQQAAEQTHQQVAQGQAPGHTGTRHAERRQGAAEVGAEHQGQGRWQRDQPGRSQGGHQQHHGDAGVASPGEQRRQQQGDQRIALQAGNRGDEYVRILDALERLAEQHQRQEHQAEADQALADAFQAQVVAQAEQHQPRQQGQRCQQRGVEAEQLHHQGGADVGPEHDRQGRRQAECAAGGERGGHQAGGGAALQQAGDAEPGQQRQPAVAQVAAEPVAQGRAEATQHAAGNHMGPPQQQGHGAGQIDQ